MRPLRKQDQYRFSWYVPLAGLKLRWAAEQDRPPDAQLRLHTIRTKMYVLRQQLQQQAVRSRAGDTHNTGVTRCVTFDVGLFFHTHTKKMCLCVQKGPLGMNLGARNRKKLEQMEVMLLTHSPGYRLDLHSPSGKVHIHTHTYTHAHTQANLFRINTSAICFVSLQSYTLLFSSLFELEEWREAIHKLTTDSKFTCVG